jgi:DNA repair exonuclease SbcCD ATPase subunit
VSGRLWGCSWRKNRGPAACSNEAKIPEAILERVVMDAVREALDQDVAALALEVALADLRQRVAKAQPDRLKEELAGLDAKIARALDLAIELGDLVQAKDRLRTLRAERERVAGELARARVELPTAEELLPRLREMLRRIEATLRADAVLGRL